MFACYHCFIESIHWMCYPSTFCDSRYYVIKYVYVFFMVPNQQCLLKTHSCVLKLQLVMLFWPLGGSNWSCKSKSIYTSSRHRVTLLQANWWRWVHNAFSFLTTSEIDNEREPKQTAKRLNAPNRTVVILCWFASNTFPIVNIRALGERI